MEDLSFTVKGDNGEEIKCDILFTFENDNKNYVVYTDNTTDEEGELVVLASLYTLEDDNIILEEIKTDAEWDLVDEKLEEKYNEMLEEDEYIEK
ncbi:MAG: DUF1292 domain-containing protein [Bacilli bacterium]|nr:DUF1292 domain-containing protein [Bacilli bacterium]